jgi:hypothetical protein
VGPTWVLSPPALVASPQCRCSNYPWGSRPRGPRADALALRSRGLGRGKQRHCRSSGFLLPRSSQRLRTVHALGYHRPVHTSLSLRRDRSVTPARHQRDCYALHGLSGSSSMVGELASICDSQDWTASTTASSWATVRLRSNPSETSVVWRISARSSEDDSGSTQAWMTRSPLRVLVTDQLCPRP